MKANFGLPRVWNVFLGALLVLGVASARQVLAKVGLESFPQAQQDWLWARVDEYARTEAAFRVCGRNTNFEQRIVAAAQNCATAEAIQRVRTVFRRKVASYTPLYRSILKPAGQNACRVPDIIGMLDQAEGSLDSAVEDVRRACSTCMIC